MLNHLKLTRSALRICLTVLLMLSAALPLCAQEKKPAQSPFQSGPAYKSMMEFLNALALIRTTYVDADKVTDEKLFKAALRGLLHELDAYSDYESSETFKATREETTGEIAGIGVVVTCRNRTLEIMEVRKDSPAAKAGLKAGDLILEIDGKTFDNMSGGVRLLRGEVGDPVRLKVYRSANDTTSEITVERAVIRLSSVTGAKIIAPGVGYLRIMQFGTRTASELDQALAQLDQQGMKQLVIDLRNNPGGLVIAAGDACSRFLTPGKRIVSLEGRNAKEKQVIVAKPCKSYPDLPVAVLINENTASAAEIMTACLQDHKRAVAIGERTFGKGVVQTLIPFGEKEALRITTAKYYTPARRVIQDNGIEPDVAVPLSTARNFALAAQLNFHPGEIRPKIPNAVRDIQLERAMEILKAVRLFKDGKQ